MFRRNAAIALSAILLLGMAIGGRHGLEARMLTHVLIQMPLLVAGGALLTCLQPLTYTGKEPDLYRFWNKCDALGMTSMLTVLFCCAYWMMPNAIEHAVANPFAETVKFFNLIFAGALLPGALRKSRPVLRLVFAVSMVGMLTMAGLVYLHASVRLCNSYLLEDQMRAGIGLMIMAAMLPAWWCAVVSRHRFLQVARR